MNGVWAGLALGLLAAAAYLPMAGSAVGAARSVLKTLPLAGFALAAWLGGGAPFLVAGLALSALGDLALSRAGRAAFLYGLAAFGLAHLCYILGFVSVSGTALWDAFADAPLAAPALILLALSTELWLAPQAGSLVWPLRGYIALITAMGLAALSLPPDLAAARAGAGLFIASDLLLGIRRFRLRDGHAAALPVSWALWVLYIAGQALIAIAFLGP